MTQGERCSEADWRVYREVSDAAIDRFCERALAEIADALQSSELSPFARLERVDDISRRHRRELERNFAAMSRSKVRWQLFAMHAAGLLEPEEMARFSDDMRTTFRDVEALGARSSDGSER